MKLTGKAKEDFNKWVYDNDECYFTDASMKLYQHALIIEWFDSLGIYIEPFNEFGDFGFSIHKGDYKNPIESIGHWKTRQEAIEQAIIKANEIYNGV